MTVTPPFPNLEALITEHLYIVQDIVRYRIHVNEQIQGLGLEDLTQEGYVHLCRAAHTYLPGKCASFPTYAKKVVYNGLITYCRSLQHCQSLYSDLRVGPNGELMGCPQFETADESTIRISTLETMTLLHDYSQRYRGVTRKGIQALILKINGAGVTEIANIYHVPPSHIGAWISQAVKRLRNDPDFISALL